jgi:hypothetical protein
MMKHAERGELDVIPPLGSVTITLDVSPLEIELGPCHQRRFPVSSHHDGNRRRHGGRCGMAGSGALRRPSSASRQPPLIGPDMAAIAANHLLDRNAGGKGASGLGEGEALLGDHALRLELPGRSAKGELHHPQAHDFLRLLTQARGIEGKFHPGCEHGFPPRLRPAP